MFPTKRIDGALQLTQTYSDANWNLGRRCPSRFKNESEMLEQACLLRLITRGDSMGGYLERESFTSPQY